MYMYMYIYVYIYNIDINTHTVHMSHTYIHWLVVWNIFSPFSWEFHLPNWGTAQPPTSTCYILKTHRNHDHHIVVG